MLFLHCISRFEVISYKKFYDTTTRSLYFLLFLLALISTGIIFYNFLELHSTLTGKKIFVRNFPFLKDSLNSPRPQPP